MIEEKPGHRWRGRSTGILVLVLLILGCGTKHSLRTEQPDIILQWPYQPNRAKVTYVQSLTGMTSRRSFGARLRSVVVGSEQQDKDAFVLPVAVATGGDGRIAVADRGRACVHLYLPGEQLYRRLTGTKKDRIASPVAVIFDDEMKLYLSDSTGKVFVFDPAGDPLLVLRTAGGEALQRPTGLAYSQRRNLIYVVDTLAHRVHALQTSGELAFSFGERGEGEGQFNFPTYITHAPSGELYVTDSLNFRIGIFDEQGRPLGSFGHHGDGSGDLAMPKGLAVDSDGIVYVVDSLFDNVQLFSRKGEFLLTIGQRGVDFGEFWLPAGIFIDGSDRLYVCDTYNRRVQVFRVTGGYADGAS